MGSPARILAVALIALGLAGLMEFVFDPLFRPLLTDDRVTAQRILGALILGSIVAVLAALHLPRLLKIPFAAAALGSMAAAGKLMSLEFARSGSLPEDAAGTFLVSGSVIYAVWLTYLDRHRTLLIILIGFCLAFFGLRDGSLTGHNAVATITFAVAVTLNSTGYRSVLDGYAEPRGVISIPLDVMIRVFPIFWGVLFFEIFLQLTGIERF